jgi:hypothetical protein
MPSRGAKKAIMSPRGDKEGLERTASPKRSGRAISGAWGIASGAGAVCCWHAASADTKPSAATAAARQEIKLIPNVPTFAA